MPINVLCVGAIGPCSALLAIARRNGFFTSRGVDIRPVRVPDKQIPEPSPDNPLAHIGAPAALLRASDGVDLKVIACFDTARLSSCLVVNSKIKSPEQLRGTQLGARIEGAAMWIHTVLALERLGLQPERDQIKIAKIGDPLDVVEALEDGLIAGAVLPRAQSEQLAKKGYSILLDLLPCDVHGAPDAVVTTTSFLYDHQDTVESIVAGLIEAAAFSLSPGKRPLALAAIKADQKLIDDAAAEVGRWELMNCIARKPYPSIKRLCEMQRFMSANQPKVRSVSIDELVYNHIVRKLDQAGFIDRIYASYGVT